MKQLLLFLSLLVFMPLANAQETEQLTHMPDWELYKQNGTLLTSSDYEGQPLILHFWATWCPFCKRLQPELDRLERAYKDDGLNVLAVSLRESADAEPQSALVERGLQLQTVLKGEKLGIEQFGILGTPTTVFIGPDGKILGSTTDSDPDDPRWESVVKQLVSLPKS